MGGIPIGWNSAGAYTSGAPSEVPGLPDSNGALLESIVNSMNLLQSLGNLNALNTIQALSSLTTNSLLHHLAYHALAGVAPWHGFPYWHRWGGSPLAAPDPPAPFGPPGPPPAGPSLDPLPAAPPPPSPLSPTVAFPPTSIGWDLPRTSGAPDQPSHRRVYQTGEVRYFYADR